MRARVIVNGAHGKMGKLACKILEHHPEFELVGTLGRKDVLRTYIVSSKANIVIDFTRADSVFANCLAIIEEGAHPVVGTSGLQEDQVKLLSDLCDRKKLGGIIAPNFSIAAVLMMRFAAEASRFFSEVEIVEAHHQHKFDAPSGTAMKTAELIAKARTSKKNKYHAHEIVKGSRGGVYQQVPIHSLRIPGVLAQQQVIFGSNGETLTLCHNSIDRESFAPGILFACQRVKELEKLYYGLENLL